MTPEGRKDITVATWRIRITISDDAQSRAALDEVLADQHVSAVNLAARNHGSTDVDAEVLLELPAEESLGDLLSALHRISPQVLVSLAADAASAQAHAGSAAGLA
jgi:hypothetical protein